MASNSKNGKYTAQQFIDAMPGTGGVVSDIADRVGCAWNTARAYINKHPTVKNAWQNERNKITDKAQSNIIKVIETGDLQMSKWWLQVMDDDFNLTIKQEIVADVTTRYKPDLSKLTDAQMAKLAELRRLISGDSTGDDTP